jgi:hypothetical protein
MFNRFWQGVLMGVVLGMVVASRYLRGGAEVVKVEEAPVAPATPAAAVQGPRRVLARLAVPGVRRG